MKYKNVLNIKTRENYKIKKNTLIIRNAVNYLLKIQQYYDLHHYRLQTWLYVSSHQQNIELKKRTVAKVHLKK